MIGGEAVLCVACLRCSSPLRMLWFAGLRFVRIGQNIARADPTAKLPTRISLTDCCGRACLFPVFSMPPPPPPFRRGRTRVEVSQVERSQRNNAMDSDRFVVLTGYTR